MTEADLSKLERKNSLNRTIQRCGKRIEELRRSIATGQLPGSALLAAAKEGIEVQERQAAEELASLGG